MGKDLSWWISLLGQLFFAKNVLVLFGQNVNKHFGNGWKNWPISNELRRIERGQGVEALSSTKYLRFIFYLVIH